MRAAEVGAFRAVADLLVRDTRSEEFFARVSAARSTHETLFLWDELMTGEAQKVADALLGEGAFAFPSWHERWQKHPAETEDRLWRAIFKEAQGDLDYEAGDGI